MPDNDNINTLDDAIAHLGSCISQRAASDDKIIAEHILVAHALLKDLRRRMAKAGQE